MSNNNWFFGHKPTKDVKSTYSNRYHYMEALDRKYMVIIDFSSFFSFQLWFVILRGLKKNHHVAKETKYSNICWPWARWKCRKSNTHKNILPFETATLAWTCVLSVLSHFGVWFSSPPQIKLKSSKITKVWEKRSLWCTPRYLMSSFSVAFFLLRSRTFYSKSKGLIWLIFLSIETLL